MRVLMYSMMTGEVFDVVDRYLTVARRSRYLDIIIKTDVNY